MKSIVSAISLCLLLTSTQCKQDSTLPIEPGSCEDTIKIWLPGNLEKGAMKAVKTCRDWTASGECRQSSTDYMLTGTTYFTLVSGGKLRYLTAEILSLRMPKAEGKYPVRPSSADAGSDDAIGQLYRLEDDVGLASWDIDTTAADNELEITEINEETKRIRGRFTVNFVLDPATPEPEKHPARLRFFNGEFDVEMPE